MTFVTLVTLAMTESRLVTCHSLEMTTANCTLSLTLAAPPAAAAAAALDVS